MRKIIFLFIISLFWGLPSFGFEKPYPSLITPSQLDAQLWMTTFSHRFYGALDNEPLENWFGMDGGSNTKMGIRYALLNEIDIQVSRTSKRKSFEGILRYTQMIQPNIPIMVAGLIDSYKDPSTQEQLTASAAMAGINFSMLNDRLQLSSLLLYDNEIEKTGFGFGGSYQMTPDYHLYLEGYPTPFVSGNKISYSWGIRYHTFGHRFLAYVANNTEHSVRHQMNGVEKSTPYLGFKITRILE